MSIKRAFWGGFLVYVFIQAFSVSNHIAFAQAQHFSHEGSGIDSCKSQQAQVMQAQNLTKKYAQLTEAQRVTLPHTQQIEILSLYRSQLAKFITFAGCMQVHTTDPKLRQRMSQLKTDSESQLAARDKQLELLRQQRF